MVNVAVYLTSSVFEFTLPSLAYHFLNVSGSVAPQMSTSDCSDRSDRSFPQVRGVVVGDSLMKWAKLPGFSYVKASTTSKLWDTRPLLDAYRGREIVIVCCGSNDLMDGTSYQDIISNLINYKNEVAM